MEFNDIDSICDSIGGISPDAVKKLEGKVRDLEIGVKQRDEYTYGLTNGYIKDISHMKEMIFRK